MLIISQTYKTTAQPSDTSTTTTTTTQPSDQSTVPIEIIETTTTTTTRSLDTSTEPSEIITTTTTTTTQSSDTSTTSTPTKPSISTTNKPISSNGGISSLNVSLSMDLSLLCVNKTLVEEVLSLFYKRYLSSLESVSILIECRSYLRNFDIVNSSLNFRINDIQSFQVVQEQFKTLANILDKNLPGFEKDFADLASQKNLTITIGFNESIAGTKNASLSSFSCRSISCLNSYFVNNDASADTSYCCVHLCESKAEEYCKNSAECLADVTSGYEPKCS